MASILFIKFQFVMLIKPLKLIDLGRCLKCSGLGLMVESFNFRFYKKCFRCIVRHFSYLCSKESKVKKVVKVVESKAADRAESPKVTPTQVKNGSALVTGSMASCIGYSALPTYTCRSKNVIFSVTL